MYFAWRIVSVYSLLACKCARVCVCLRVCVFVYVTVRVFEFIIHFV